MSESDQLRVKDWCDRRSGFLIYQGAPGCGKTHFCAAILHDMLIKFGRFDFYVWEEKSLYQRVRDAMDHGDHNEAISSGMDHQLIIYDDLGSMGVNEFRREVVLSAIDERYKSNRPTVITSNLSESEIKEMFGARTYSRLFSKKSIVLDFGTIDWRRKEEDQDSET